MISVKNNTPLPCAHQRMHPGLDRCYCPDCRKEFLPKSQEYKDALFHPTAPVPCGNCTGAKSTSTQNSKRSAPVQNHWVETYCSSKRKENLYYRYVWMDGRRMRHRHIPGGNIHSPEARRKRAEVELAIALHKSPAEIEALIKGWRRTQS